MISLLKFLVKFKPPMHPSKSSKTGAGFTMIELLVGTIIAFIIITPLMGMVIGLLNDDSREQAKATTEQELQQALDYITEDVSQAVYIYKPADVTTIATQFPSGADGTPKLIFWKRKLVENSLPVGASTITPNKCNQPDFTIKNPKNCDGTYVLALVAYYEKPTTAGIWCQPAGTPCPKQITRYEIQDKIKKLDGTYYDDADLLTTDPQQTKDTVFNSSFDFDKPTTSVTLGTTFPSSQILVNYIESLSIDKVPDTNNEVEVKIKGNALRRLQADATCPTTGTNPYCPTATIKLRSLSGLGE